jgi:hypothetical protein
MPVATSKSDMRVEQGTNFLTIEFSLTVLVVHRKSSASGWGQTKVRDRRYGGQYATLLLAVHFSSRRKLLKHKAFPHHISV